MSRDPNELHPGDQPLLSDEEFARLVEAEHEALGADALDEVRKRRLLRTIEDSLPSTAPRRRLAFWAGPLAAGLLFYVGVSSFLLKGEHERERMKGADSGIPVRLLAYVSKGGGDLRNYDGGRLAEGEMLVFDVNAAQPGVAALIAKEGHAPLRQIYKVEVVRAGEDTPLARGGSGFGYRVAAGEPEAKLCAVAAPDDEALSKVLEFLPPRYDALPPEACVTVPPA